MKTLIIILFHCSFAILLLLLGYMVVPNGYLNRMPGLQSDHLKPKFVIVQFYIEKGEIRTHQSMEYFSSYEAAQERLKDFPAAGFFWTGLHEYKIVEEVSGVYKKCYGGSSLHNDHLAIQNIY